jgi:hypothetical protein
MRGRARLGGRAEGHLRHPTASGRKREKLCVQIGVGLDEFEKIVPGDGDAAAWHGDRLGSLSSSLRRRFERRRSLSDCSLDERAKIRSIFMPSTAAVAGGAEGCASAPEKKTRY